MSYSPLVWNDPLQAPLGGGMPSFTDGLPDFGDFSKVRGPQNSLLDSALSTKERQGWLNPMLSVAQTGLGAYFGMKNYGLAKKQFAAAQDQFGKEYEAQRSLTNSQLADRQAARVASNPGAYQSVGDYMGQYAIKPLRG